MVVEERFGDYCGWGVGVVVEVLLLLMMMMLVREDVVLDLCHLISLRS